MIQLQFGSSTSLQIPPPKLAEQVVRSNARVRFSVPFLISNFSLPRAWLHFGVRRAFRLRRIEFPETIDSDEMPKCCATPPFHSQRSDHDSSCYAFTIERPCTRYAAKTPSGSASTRSALSIAFKEVKRSISSISMSLLALSQFRPEHRAQIASFACFDRREGKLISATMSNGSILRNLYVIDASDPEYHKANSHFPYDDIASLKRQPFIEPDADKTWSDPSNEKWWLS